MQQRTTNALAFGFLGVILGLLIAIFAGYSTPVEMLAAMTITAGIGAMIGWHWNEPARTRR